VKKAITSFAIIISFIISGCSKEELLFSKPELINQNMASASNGAAVYNHDKNAHYVPDEYIVVLNDDVTDVDTEADVMGKSSGGKVKKLFKRAVKGFTMKLSADGLEVMRKNPKVRYIEQDQIATVTAVQSGASWGLDRIDQQSLPLNNSYSYNTDGSSVDAYIFDTGIRMDHEEFGGRAKFGFDAVPNGTTIMDGNGHGTHVAGIIGGKTYGVAKGINLIAVRVLDDNASGYYSDIIGGLDWAIKHHTTRPAVGNISFGGGTSFVFDEMVRAAIADGIVMCVAAGNTNEDAINTSPARVVDAITVGASTSSDSKASYSNHGSIVDIFAPGSSITSAWRSSSNGYNTLSGTSMATPHATGVAALYMEASKIYSPADVQAGIKANAISNVLSAIPDGTSNLLLGSSFTQIPTPVKILPSLPTLSSPINAASAQQLIVTLNWNQSTNASSYSIEVSQTSGFSTILNSLNAITTNSTTLTGLTPGTRYYWRVKANNADGSSDWSASWSFTTDIATPTLSLPLNGATNSNLSPTLSWAAVANASSYSVEISNDATFSNVFSAKNILTTNSFSLTGLIAGTTYYWRVKANGSVVNSNWSTVWSFSTAMAGAPALTSPANNASSVTLNARFTWSSTAAPLYDIEIATKNTFGTTIIASNYALNTNSFSTTNMKSRTTYFWRVRSKSADGKTVSAWSAVWKFTTVR
jgi:hypothetical protein